ncbi:hypothetical protein [Vibrio gallaecicus]|nr:hypothetical protein [Vibrio gallaecicus]MDN3613487.1 hypothetical protein [Vibrio gallaecicus]MDN3615832.1 hypothetical protein [Vibrio gallaecicus]
MSLISAWIFTRVSFNSRMIRVAVISWSLNRLLVFSLNDLMMKLTADSV